MHFFRDVNLVLAWSMHGMSNGVALIPTGKGSEGSHLIQCSISRVKTACSRSIKICSFSYYTSGIAMKSWPFSQCMLKQDFSNYGPWTASWSRNPPTWVARMLFAKSAIMVWPVFDCPQKDDVMIWFFLQDQLAICSK